MSFWTQPSNNKSRPPPPGAFAPGHPGDSLYPNQRNGRSPSHLGPRGPPPGVRRSSTGAPRAPYQRAPTLNGKNSYSAPRQQSSFMNSRTNTMQSYNSYTSQTSISQSSPRRKSNAAPPPITAEMKAEVRRKSIARQSTMNLHEPIGLGGTMSLDSAQSHLAKSAKSNIQRRGKKKHHSNMIRTNTDTEWTDIEKDILHDEMAQQLLKLRQETNEYEHRKSLRMTPQSVPTPKSPSHGGGDIETHDFQSKDSEEFVEEKNMNRYDTDDMDTLPTNFSDSMDKFATINLTSSNGETETTKEELTKKRSARDNVGTPSLSDVGRSVLSTTPVETNAISL